jgi:hypothetical protein
MEVSILSLQKQRALELVIEALKFLFYELNRPLRAWLQVKGQDTRPVKIEPVERSESIAVRLDDLELAVRKDLSLLPACKLGPYPDKTGSKPIWLRSKEYPVWIFSLTVGVAERIRREETCL